ncbi:MAG: MaoC family dehydratase [Chloroflexi bacterium]|nr:MaoC family dehydratase [Chloroflexota bacterium]
MRNMPEQNGPYFEDVDLGDEIGPIELVATDENVTTFCELWGNPMPNRFTSQEIAEKSGLPGPIVPGVMSMAIMSQALTDWAGPESLKDLDLVFRLPIPHNKPLFISATVIDTRQEEGNNVVECDVLMTGTAGERYVGGTALLSLPSSEEQ